MEDSEREKDVQVGGRLKMNWVGDMNAQQSDSDESRHRLSGTEGADKHKTNRRTLYVSPNLLFTSASVSFKNSQMRGAEPAAAGLSASNVLTL